MDKRSINRGRQLKFAREHRNISQSNLCSNITGLSKYNLDRFEKGFNSLSDDLVEKIMNFLECPVEWLDKEPIKIEFLCQ